MRTDTYTRIVLTVIAGSLLWLCALESGWPVHAQQTPAVASGPPQPVVIVGWGTVDSDGLISLTTRRDKQTVTTDPAIPISVVQATVPLDVRLEYSEAQPLPVGLTHIKAVGRWDPIRSAVEEEPLRSRPGRREIQNAPE